ncbi:MAG: (2Fe-2S)-binding protein [Nitrososphaeraceae archaeon]|nr:(2Fe-2S)-binding protein [Nitrososphaeraceae archaeon]
MRYIPVLPVNELKNKEHKVVLLNGKKIILFKTDGKITAISNTCPHKAGPLGDGKIESRPDGMYIVCPWHGWKYNLVTGKVPPGYEGQQAVFDTKIEDGMILVSENPIINPEKIEPKENPLQDLIDLQYQTSNSSLNILGISTTNMNKNLPRVSTSELVLDDALKYAKEKYGASTVLIKLRDLEFRHCEGYYSRNEQACTWPCSISEMDPNDGMNEIYRKMVLWADMVIIGSPIRWGNPSALYFKMIERLNCVQNQITLQDRILIKNKVVCFIITGGQDNIQNVAGQMSTFFTQLGFSLPPFAFMGWSRGWIAEDMENNATLFSKSRYVKRSVKDLVDNSLKTLRQIKGDICIDINSPQPKLSESLNI